MYKHTQAGYQSATLPTSLTPGGVTKVALLHGACVAALTPEGRYLFQHGGYVTKSTMRAMNGFVAETRGEVRVRIISSAQMEVVDAEGYALWNVLSCV